MNTSEYTKHKMSGQLLRTEFFEGCGVQKINVWSQIHNRRKYGFIYQQRLRTV